jgi:hypothetical protein
LLGADNWGTKTMHGLELGPFSSIGWTDQKLNLEIFLSDRGLVSGESLRHDFYSCPYKRWYESTFLCYSWRVSSLLISVAHES